MLKGRVMKKLIIVLATFSLLTGCAKNYTWVKPGATNSEFYKAKSYCQAISTGATPMDYSAPSSSTTYHSGSVYSSGSSYGSYSGTSTTYYNNTSQTFANLGESISRQNIFNDCMRGEGWLPEEKYGRSQHPVKVSPPLPERPVSPDIGATTEPLASSLPIELTDLPYPGSKVTHQITVVSPLEIVDETDDYYKFKSSHGAIGWSLKSHVKEVIPVKAEIAVLEAATAIAYDSKVIPLRSSLPLEFYRSPSKRSDVAFILTESTELTIIKESGGMLMVEDTYKHWGWISAESVTPIPLEN